jgi:DNA-binding NarL/FixJ family response regulator
MSNTSKRLFLASNGIPDREGYSGLTELCERYQGISVVVLSGQREAVVGALQLMFGGSASVPTKIHAHDDASASRHNQKQPAISLPHVSVSASDLGLTERQLDVLALRMHGKATKLFAVASIWPSQP